MKRQEDFFAAGEAPGFAFWPIVDEPSSLPSLDRRTPSRKNARRSSNNISTLVANPVHRFEESIAGRPCQIEVAAVARDRWRAYILRAPGVPTALMPFYGRTPDEAARLLTDWLNRAHRRATATSAG